MITQYLLYNSIKSNIETITENIGNYNKVCSKAKDQFETFEKQEKRHSRS